MKRCEPPSVYGPTLQLTQCDHLPAFIKDRRLTSSRSKNTPQSGSLSRRLVTDLSPDSCGAHMLSSIRQRRPLSMALCAARRRRQLSAAVICLRPSVSESSRTSPGTAPGHVIVCLRGRRPEADCEPRRHEEAARRRASRGARGAARVRLYKKRKLTGRP